MAFKKTNKESLPVIMTVHGDQVLATTGSLVGSGTSLGVLDGQIGLISWDYTGSEPLGDFMQAGDCSIANVKHIKIVRGTPASANTTTADIWEAGNKARIESGVIRPEYITSVATKVARFPKWGACVITDFDTPQDSVEYKVYARMLSVRNDRDYGDNDNVIHALVPALDHTTLGTTDALDFNLQTLGDAFNRYSKYVAINNYHQRGNFNILVLGVDSTGTSGGTVLDTIALGSTVSFITIDGLTSSFVADEAFIVSLSDACSKAGLDPAVATLELIDVTTAGESVTIDTLIAFGLPHTTAAYDDNIEQVQTRIELNLGGGFTTDSTSAAKTTVFPEEGTGQGSKWALLAEGRNDLQIHTKQNRPYGDYFATGKNYVDPNRLYTSVIVEYIDTEETLSTTVKSPKQLILLFATEVDADFTVDVASVYANIEASAAPIDIFSASTDAGAGLTSANVAASFESTFTAWFETARAVHGFDLIGDAVAANYLP